MSLTGSQLSLCLSKQISEAIRLPQTQQEGLQGPKMVSCGPEEVPTLELLFRFRHLVGAAKD